MDWRVFVLHTLLYTGVEGSVTLKYRLWLALGPRTYRYMKNVLAQDPRSPRAREIDIVVRKDGIERRIEADWVRSIARILTPNKRIKLEPTPPGPSPATQEAYSSNASAASIASENASTAAPL